MHKIVSVIKVLFSTTAKKYPGFFVLKIIRMLVTTGMPFIALFISPLIVDEIVGERDVKRLITLAALLIGLEVIFQLLNDLTTNYINRYSTRIERYFEVLMSRHVMELDFQLTEDKEALEQIEKARTGMEWYLRMKIRLILLQWLPMMQWLRELMQEILLKQLDILRLLPYMLRSSSLLLRYIPQSIRCLYSS